jgi:hypothetical protein
MNDQRYQLELVLVLVHSFHRPSPPLITFVAWSKVQVPQHVKNEPALSAWRICTTCTARRGKRLDDLTIGSSGDMLHMPGKRLDFGHAVDRPHG